jgi:hypothetical protein
LGYGAEGIPGGALAWTNWIAGLVAVYASLFGIGKIVFGETARGVTLMVVAVLAFAWIARSFRDDMVAPEGTPGVLRQPSDVGTPIAESP